MKRLILFLALFCLTATLFAQSVGINANGATPDSSAMLDVQSTDKGMLLPRLTREQRDAISNPAAGLYIYNLDDSCFNYYTGAQWILDCGRSDLIRELAPSIIQGNNINSFPRINGLVSDDAGNIYVAGSFRDTLHFGNATLSSTDGSLDTYVLKLNAAGQMEWIVQGISTGTDFAYAIALDEADNVCIVGTYEGTISFGELAPIASVVGSDDIFVAKVSSDGQALWAKSLGGSSGLDVGRGVATDANGNVYAMGQFEGAAFFGNSDTLISLGSLDFFITKLNPNGQVRWAKRFGGTRFDLANHITADANGNVYATGLLSGIVNFGGVSYTALGGKNAMFAMKLNTAG